MNKTPKHAFTMIEVMGAVAILAISLVTLIRIQTQSINSVVRVGTYERALFITENQLHWTLLDLNEAEFWEEYSELSGEDGDYDWQVLIEQEEGESAGNMQVTLLRITATTSWPEGAGRGEVNLQTYYLWGGEQ